MTINSIMYGQEIPSAIIKHIDEKKSTWNLEENDVTNLIISDHYIDKNTGLSYYYLEQSFEGVNIDRSTSAFIITSDGSIHSSGNAFYRNIKDRIKRPDSQRLSQEKAILIAAYSMDLVSPLRLQSETSRWDDVYVFNSENYPDNIHVQQTYVMTQSGQFVLSWKINLNDPQSADTWEVFIDAITGEKISSFNQTIYCHHPEGKFAHMHQHCSHNEQLNLLMQDAPEAEYLVYPFPLVDPREGGRTIENDNQFPGSSPMGWHTTNESGNFRTITRGNNVHAYEDIGNINQSMGNEPDGGENLSFIFPHDLNAEPEVSKDAAVTQLFYANNLCHDIFYTLGFTEVAGNFQENNFNLGGRENDYVMAEALDGRDIGNANFASPRDGQRGRMQMYLFSNLPGVLKIEQPANLNDLRLEIGGASFGPETNEIDINAEVAFSVTNDRENPTQACQSVVNDVQNKIALIDRGGCDFSLKVLNAQRAGAVMAMVCNVEGVDGGTGDELITMGAGEGANNVNIPSFFLKKSDCDIIKTTIRNGQSVVMSAKERENEGPDFLDSSFDNGVIIHEYGHGVSIRLTGGPTNSGCLPNFDDDGDGFPDRGEQMGEGWSDFFGLVLTTKVGDIGTTPRGIGTYLTNSSEDDGGFRVFPFSTDMDINPLTYDDIKTQSVPHGVGTVWAAILWDMYWAMIDIYGFNPDWTDQSSGNYMAAFLVMEGMKLQPCRPGFVDGRNAILQADAIHYNGEHSKLIWEAFARRGVGVMADQGSALDNRDGTEDFSIPPLLIEELKIEKEVSNFVDAGENYNVSIQGVNHIPSTQTGVTVIDELPEGTVYVNGSGNIEPEVIGNTLVFDLGDLDYLEGFSISYMVNTDPDIASVSLYLDDVESTSTEWSTQSRQGSTTWSIVTNQALSGDRAWYIEETNAEEIDQLLISPSLLVTGTNPVFRFWHRYEIVSGANGGFIEISTDGNNWSRVDDQFIVRNEYPGELAFSTFAIPALNGFSGSTERKWVDSYIDLNAFKGQNIRVRFRFGNEGELVSNGEDPGWFIDEMEVVDLKTYSTAACIHSDQDPDERCTPIQTTVINSSSTTSTNPDIGYQDIKVYPNPVKDLLNVSSQKPINGILRLQSSEGKIIRQENLSNTHSIQLDISQFPSGIYLLHLSDWDASLVKKIIITD